MSSNAAGCNRAKACVERLVATEFQAGPVQQVEELRVDLADFAGIMVTQEAIQRAQPVGDIVTPDSEDDRNPLAGMGVIEIQAACIGQRGQRGFRERQNDARHCQLGRVTEKQAA